MQSTDALPGTPAFRVVLVSPSRSTNVGAVARSMVAFGFSDLAIVDSLAHRTPEASWVAHGAQDLLSDARTYPNLDQALRGVDFAVATTQRHRGAPRHYHTPTGLCERIREKGHTVGRVALVFGGEASGLSNRDVNRCDALSRIPQAVSYPSLNLAQAVTIYLYALTAPGEAPRPTAAATRDADADAQSGAYTRARERIQALLNRLGVGANTTLAHWIREGLVWFTARDIALLHLLLKDLEAGGVSKREGPGRALEGRADALEGEGRDHGDRDGALGEHQGDTQLREPTRGPTPQDGQEAKAEGNSGDPEDDPG